MQAFTMGAKKNILSCSIVKLIEYLNTFVIHAYMLYIQIPRLNINVHHMPICPDAGINQALKSGSLTNRSMVQSKTILLSLSLEDQTDQRIKNNQNIPNTEQTQVDQNQATISKYFVISNYTNRVITRAMSASYVFI